MIRRFATRLPLALLALLLGAAGAGPSDSEPRVLGEDLEPLRGRFNRRADHVRAVLLVAPT